MLYGLEQDRTEKTIITQCMREGRPLPHRIQNAPQLYQGLELFYSAFLDLNSCRPVGFGEGAISWIDIFTYCKLLELDEEETEEMLYFIPRMDRIYLEWQSKKKGK